MIRTWQLRNPLAEIVFHSEAYSREASRSIRV
jgi:hypothetical protein